MIPRKFAANVESSIVMLHKEKWKYTKLAVNALSKNALQSMQSPLLKLVVTESFFKPSFLSSVRNIR